MTGSLWVGLPARKFLVAAFGLVLALLMVLGGMTTPVSAQTAPTVISVSPSHGPVAGGTTVTITGTDLTGATAVIFGTVDVTTGFAVNATGTEITVTSPPGTAGMVRVSVTTPNGTSADAAADDFTYALPPEATASFSPTTIPADLATTSTVTYVIRNPNPTQALTGVGYRVSLPAGLSYVSASASILPSGADGVIGNVVGGNTIDVDVATLQPNGVLTLTFRVRSSIVGSYTINGGGTTSSAGTGAAGITPTPLTVTETAPSITAMSPTVGGVAGGTTVAIDGTRFLTATGVTFGGVPATSFTIISQTRINAVAPAGTAGTVQVAVTNAAATTPDTAADDFTYLEPPTLTASFAPTSIPANGTTQAAVTVTIDNPNSVNLTGVGITSATLPSGLRGAGLFSTCSGGTATLNVGTGALTLSGVTIPANASCTLVVGVTSTTPGVYAFTTGQPTGAFGTGTAAATSNSLTVLALPAVTSLSPASGPLAGGTAVTITGTAFTGATRVSFGSVDVPAASFTSVRDTQIVVPAPAGSAGTVRVSVTTPQGTSPDAAQDDFTYVASPTLTSFTFGTTVPYNAGSATAIDVAALGNPTDAPSGYAVVSGTTPGGGTVSIDSAGLASYTPAVGFRGTDSFQVTATNAGGTSASATVSVNVGDPVFAATVPVASGTVGVAYSQQVSMTGGTAPYSGFSATGLPDGLTISSSGVITGKPTTAGTFASVLVTATDSSTGTGGFTGTASAFALTIAQASQTITFPDPAQMSFFTGDEVALTATASSGLTVQFSTLTPDICSVSLSGLVRFLAVGACTVAADQPGNADVAAAAQVTKTLTVGGVDPSIEVELITKMQTARARALILNQPDLVPLLGDTSTGTTALSFSSKGAEQGGRGRRDADGRAGLGAPVRQHDRDGRRHEGPLCPVQPWHACGRGSGHDPWPHGDGGQHPPVRSGGSGAGRGLAGRALFRVASGDHSSGIRCPGAGGPHRGSRGADGAAVRHHRRRAQPLDGQAVGQLCRERKPDAEPPGLPGRREPGERGLSGGGRHPDSRG